MAGTIVRELFTRWSLKADASQALAFQKTIEATKNTASGAGQAIGNLTGNFFSLKNMVGLAVGALGGLTLATLIQAPLKLQTSLRDTLTIAGKSGKELLVLEADMKKFAIDLSNKTGMAATEIAQGGFYQAISSGLSPMTKEFENLTIAGVNMAKLVGMSVPDAIERISDVSHAYNLSMEKSTEVGDMMFKTSFLAATTVPQLAEAMKTAAPIAGAYGQSLAGTLSILGAFSAKGIKGSEGGEAFKQVLTKFAAPKAEADKALSALGINVYDKSGKMLPMIQILQQLQVAYAKLTQQQQNYISKVLVGERAISKFAAIMSSDLSIISGFEGAIKDAGGAMQDSIGIKGANAAGQLAKIRNELVNTASEILDGVLPALTSGLTDIKKYIDLNKPEIVAFGQQAVAALGTGAKVIVEHGSAIATTGEAVLAIWAGGKIIAAIATVVKFGEAFFAVGGFAFTVATHLTTVYTILSSIAGVLATIASSPAIPIIEAIAIIRSVDKAERAWSETERTQRKQTASREINEQNIKEYSAEINRLKEEGKYSRKEAVQIYNNRNKFGDTGRAREMLEIEKRFGKGSKQSERAAELLTAGFTMAEISADIANVTAKEGSAEKARIAGLKVGQGMIDGLKGQKNKAQAAGKDFLKWLVPGFDEETRAGISEYFRQQVYKGGNIGRANDLKGQQSFSDNSTVTIIVPGAGDPSAVAGKIEEALSQRWMSTLSTFRLGVPGKLGEVTF